MKELLSRLLGYVTAEYGISDSLALAYLIVSALVIIMGIVALVMKLLIWIRYSSANKKPISSRMSGLDAARYVLDREGLTQIKVRKAGLIREALFGNYYNIFTKTIYLRSIFGKIDDKQSVTSTALAVQKAGVAELCESGDTAAVVRNRLSLIGIFGPFLFIPLVLIGAVLDYFVLKTDGKLSVLALIVGGAFLVGGFIVTFLNIPVEKKANKLALKLLRDHGLANEEELKTIEKVYDTYILSYICDFILEVLRIVQWILEIVIKTQSKSKN